MIDWVILGTSFSVPTDMGFKKAFILIIEVMMIAFNKIKLMEEVYASRTRR
jgi:hypothetical protein